MSVERTTVEGLGRIYYSDRGSYLSVSTILSNGLPTPSGVKRWKARNDNWREIRNFKGNRGTLIHYTLLNPLADRELWSSDEASSRDELRELTEAEADQVATLDASTKEELASKATERDEYGVCGEIDPVYDGVDGEWVSEEWYRYTRDVEYAKKAWRAIKAHQGLSTDSAIHVERFVTEPVVGYAGQFDLLYQDRSGDVVLGDIKTGKGVYDKYRLQLSAYANAVEIPVDRIEVIRVSPDRKEWEIQTEDEWPKGRDAYFEEFCSLRNDVYESDLEDRLKEYVD